MTIAHEVARRRTFAIISHPDAGKTTLTEKLLLFAGAIQIAGSVKARKATRHATSDWMEIEKQRGISVASSVMQMEYRDCVINLLDTPGHQDFSEDTYRVLTAVDSALMVIDAANGVETQTLRLIEVCRSRGTPIMTFINKMDREGRDALQLLDEIEEVLGMPCAPLTWPVGQGKRFGGIFDLRAQRMRVFQPGQDRRRESDDLIDNMSLLRERFGAEFEQAESEMELVQTAAEPFSKELFVQSKQTPVFFGSAINNFGVQEVLDALVDLAPIPSARKAVSRQVSPDESRFSGVVFKIQANMDPAHRDRIAFLRVCSGVFERGMKLRVRRTAKDLRPTGVVTFYRKDATWWSRPTQATLSASSPTVACNLVIRFQKAKPCSTLACHFLRLKCLERSRSLTQCVASNYKKDSKSSERKEQFRFSDHWPVN